MTPRPSSKRRLSKGRAAWIVVDYDGAPRAVVGRASLADAWRWMPGASVIRVEYEWPPAPKRATRKGAQGR